MKIEPVDFIAQNIVGRILLDFEYGCAEEEGICPLRPLSIGKRITDVRIGIDIEGEDAGLLLTVENVPEEVFVYDDEKIHLSEDQNDKP